MARVRAAGAQEIEGMKPLLKKLAKLKKSVQGRVARRAIGEGTKILAKDVKRSAPRDTGTLRASIGRKQKTFRTSGNTVGWVGPREGFARDTPKGRRDPRFYAHLVEFAPGKSYLRKSLDEGKGRVQSAVSAKLRSEIAKEASKG